MRRYFGVRRLDAALFFFSYTKCLIIEKKKIENKNQKKWRFLTNFRTAHATGTFHGGILYADQATCHRS